MNMGDKKVTNTAKFVYRLCIVGLFAMVWFYLYNKYTFQTYRIRGGLVSVLIFYIVYSWLCNVYSAFRIASSSIGDIIFKQFVSFAAADFVLYMECCLIYNQYVNIIPGAITVVLQLICTVVITFVTKRYFMKSVTPKKTLVIYGKNIPLENALQFEARLLLKYSHLFKIVSTEASDLDEKVLNQYMKVTESVILYEVEDEVRGRFVQACLQNHKNFYYTPEIDDILSTGSSVRHLLDTPLMKYDYTYENKLWLFEKRVMDIVLSLIFIIITSPIMLITAICIKFEDGGPVFYKQKRHTKNMKVFEILKFRSMKIDAERYGAIPATKNDPRITKVGRVIRKVRVDELPQFFNILAGDMSFVGPRPERVEHTELYSKELPEFKYRLRVKGGLTGYAQIFGKYNTSAYDKLLLDLMYIEDQSILKDIKLILLTVRTVFEMESTEGFDREKSARMNQVMAGQQETRTQVMEALQAENGTEETEAAEELTVVGETEAQEGAETVVETKAAEKVKDVEKAEKSNKKEVLASVNEVAKPKKEKKTKKKTDKSKESEAQTAEDIAGEKKENAGEEDSDAALAASVRAIMEEEAAAASADKRAAKKKTVKEDPDADIEERVKRKKKKSADKKEKVRETAQVKPAKEDTKEAAAAKEYSNEEGAKKAKAEDMGVVKASADQEQAEKASASKKKKKKKKAVKETAEEKKAEEASKTAVKNRSDSQAEQAKNVAKRDKAEAKDAAEKEAENAKESETETIRRNVEPTVDIEDLLRDIEQLQSEAYRTGRTAGKFISGKDQHKESKAAEKKEKAPRPVIVFDAESKEFKNVEEEQKAREEEIRRNSMRGENLSDMASFIKKNLKEDVTGARIARENEKKLQEAEEEKANAAENAAEKADRESDFEEFAMEGGLLSKAVGKARTAVENAEKAKLDEQQRKEMKLKEEQQKAAEAQKASAEADAQEELRLPEQKAGVVQKMNLAQLAALIKEQEARMEEDAPAFVIPEKPSEEKSRLPEKATADQAVLYETAESAAELKTKEAAVQTVPSESNPEKKADIRAEIAGEAQKSATVDADRKAETFRDTETAKTEVAVASEREEPEFLIPKLREEDGLPELSEETRALLDSLEQEEENELAPFAMQFDADDEEGPQPIMISFDDDEAAEPAPILMEEEAAEEAGAEEKHLIDTLPEEDEETEEADAVKNHLIDIEPEEDDEAEEADAEGNHLIDIESEEDDEAEEAATEGKHLIDIEPDEDEEAEEVDREAYEAGPYVTEIVDERHASEIAAEKARIAADAAEEAERIAAEEKMRQEKKEHYENLQQTTSNLKFLLKDIPQRPERRK